MQIEGLLPAMAGQDQDEVPQPDDLHARAAAAMRALRESIPWAAYALSAWNAGSGTHRHITLASEGYEPHVQQHINDDYVANNPAFHLLHTRVPRALRWRDMDRDWDLKFANTETAEAFLLPAGFKEGTTLCLRLPDGRYTGALHVSWAKTSDATEEARNIIDGFRPLLANVCDLLGNAQRGLERMGPDAYAVLVSSEGRVSEMPGRSAGPLLSEGSQLRELLSRHPRMLKRGRYLWGNPVGGCHRIEIIPCRGQVTLVTERAIPWPFGLTHREAQILHLIVDGYSNPHIAAQLYITSRTVSTHVEHILKKLSCQSRAQLAAVAVSSDMLLVDEALGTGL
ncbi:helix-turn-helix transcriptional regulator [Saccharopolyspora mangrovi]|uniref:Helix-turn-helix transcriptional regulator n=1 Tax=Saccharopolyspora mangrovi TaxID=3082379 RepID=A0ABU6AEP5_9PSEU|nr:helix-turn-helix transcriptional regulator [Saccharopolyspora sp. S2-29]MEB3370017.1 helix-turn-helix transcriptional regulator [Saccharopolyspora sp. S2-29]